MLPAVRGCPFKVIFPLTLTSFGLSWLQAVMKKTIVIVSDIL